MVLTLHNVRMIGLGIMPYHGAMLNIRLKNGKQSTVLLMGDTATGKSETLEALRTLGGSNISQIIIIADDMGSIKIEGEAILGYGTETGAFVRLDDLPLKYAFSQIDRAIIMNPGKVNSRVVLPVTTLSEITRGYPVDFILYANNRDKIGEESPVIEQFKDLEEAFITFRRGESMAKGTTTATGVTRSYFANPFGPPEYKKEYDSLAREHIGAAIKNGIFVGQLRTRLGIPGFESKGPREAAKALIKLISE